MLYRQWTFCAQAICLHIPRGIQLKSITAKNWREFRCLEQTYIAERGELVEKDVQAIRSCYQKYPSFLKAQKGRYSTKINFSKRFSFCDQKPLVRAEEIEVYVSIMWTFRFHKAKQWYFSAMSPLRQVTNN